MCDSREGVTEIRVINKYSSNPPPISTGNIFQELTLLRETADNTERYVKGKAIPLQA
jgi:hypothetical protein